MKCPNPACRRELFKVLVVWKQKIKELPHFLPVSLECAHCHRKIKAYVLNEDVRNMVKILNEIGKNVNKIVLNIECVPEKPWWKFW